LHPMTAKVAIGIEEHFKHHLAGQGAHVPYERA
jgi:hypothetical protein